MMMTDRCSRALARTLSQRTTRLAGLTTISSMPYISGEKVPAILIRVALIGDSGFPLMSDDSLEDLHAPRQIVPIHYEWRKYAERVLAGCKREQTFVPPALHDLVR